jgi:hypothetical protein
MVPQPMRAISVLVAILAITSCNNSADKTQPSETTALSQASSTEQWQFGDEPIPAGRIHVASSHRTAVAFRSVPVTGKTAKDAYGHITNITTYQLSELPNPPNKFVGPSSDRYPTLSFLRRALLRFFDSRRVEQ